MDSSSVNGAFTGFISIAKTIFSFATVGPTGWIVSAIAMLVVLLGSAAIVFFIKKKLAQAAHKNTQKKDIEDQANNMSDNQDTSDSWNKPGPIEDRLGQLKNKDGKDG